MSWDTVIGLEVHVQLLTRSKMFCACSTVFGAPPNTNVCPVCLGLPGSLPVPNEAAVALAVRTAFALGCTVHERSRFARKHYFYPDLPKGYQISQYEEPLAEHGALPIETVERGAVRVGIRRLHLEEDAGKSFHDRVPGMTAVDLNRCGVPLIEIVTEPDLATAAEARAFLVALKQVLKYLEVSDCNMEEGSLRVDANLSVRRAGEVGLGTKTEIKNMNSFSGVERALALEAERQIATLERGEAVTQQTLLFDAASSTVRPVRTKEESHDYRYFPDPDLPPLVLSAEWLAAERDALPELPAAKRERFARVHGLPAYDAGVVSADRALADYYEAVVAAGAAPKAAANWVMGAVLADAAGGRFRVPPSRLAELLDLVERGVVSLQAGRRVFEAMAADGGRREAHDVAGRLALIQVGDRDQVRAWVEETITAHAVEVERYRRGEEKLLGFLMGQVMKRSAGRADPKAVRAALTAALDSSGT